VLIVEAHARLTRWSWVERRLFEVVGGWVASTPEPEVARWFAMASHHHAWRASLWEERRPVLHDVTVPAETGAWPTALELVAAVHETARRLAGLEAVLDVLLAEYERARSEAGEVADGPLRRGLHLAIPDATEDRQSARSLRDVAPDGSQVGDHRSSVTALLRGPDS
jgi:hypothetical protein